uniref:Uncharacterized protein n=1 Tax=Leersia perrieri TaxID=77586 RepID=A0A0D9XXH0_9ORYZ
MAPAMSPFCPRALADPKMAEVSAVTTLIDRTIGCILAPQPRRQIYTSRFAAAGASQWAGEMERRRRGSRHEGDGHEEETMKTGNKVTKRLKDAATAAMTTPAIASSQEAKRR